MSPRNAQVEQISGEPQYDDYDNDQYDYDGMPPLQQTLLVHNEDASKILKEMLFFSGNNDAFHGLH